MLINILSIIIIFLIAILPFFNILYIIPLFIIGLYIKGKYTPFIIALSFSILSLFLIFPEDWDFSRHLNSYSSYENGISYYTVPYFGLDKLFSFFSLIELDEKFLIFPFCFIFYYILSKIAIITLSKKYFNKNFEIIIILTFVFSVPIILFTGLRFSTAISLFLYGIIVCRNSNLKFLFILLSCFLHFALIFPAILYITSFFNILKLTDKKLNWFLFFLCIIFSNFTLLLIDVFSSLLNVLISPIIPSVDKLSIYLSGSWGVKYSEQLNSSGIIIFKIRYILFMIVSFLYVKKFNAFDNKNILERFAFIIILFCIVISSFSDAFVRYSYISIIVMLYISFGLENKTKYKISLLSMLLIIYVLYQQLYYGFFAMRDVFYHSFEQLTELSYFSLWLR
ncbi:EpsG family protein [Photobacterium leiognathi]|uniref:EpsG family protein n=1 Tax=Photobacterium leiognathi TaxID=553611 RepID=UPI002981C4B4|nr:EpsG family protein [Photobacterium leiognathi]